MIGLFRRWFRRPPEPQPLGDPIPVGSLWLLNDKDRGPFPPKRYAPVEVLDYRDGWVRYQIGQFFPDEVMKADMFRIVYRPLTVADYA